MSRVILVAGLNYGDEGKGSVVDFLTRHHSAKLVIRYNGGSQAAHNVVESSGRHHTFSQFGSGTFSGAGTHLSRHMLVNPITLTHEGAHLKTWSRIVDPFQNLTVERDALVTTPFHVAANRIRELLRTGRHGSCGMGIGETMQDFVEGKECLFVKDLLLGESALRRKLESIQDRKLAEIRPLVQGHMLERVYNEWLVVSAKFNELDRILDLYEAFADKVSIVGPEWFEEQLKEDQTIVFEGAQGVLLDQDFGFQPFTTWTDCTFGNAVKLLNGFTGDVTKLGIVRGYMTRHGNGPFVTERKDFKPFSDHDHNKTHGFQGAFRSGAFDLVATRYALDVIGGVDGLVFTNLDRIASPGALPYCIGYREADEHMTDRIEVRRPVDLAHQERLSTWLTEGVEPVYETTLKRDQSYALQLSEMLGVPLAITSSGPTAADKHFLTRDS